MSFNDKHENVSLSSVLIQVKEKVVYFDRSNYYTGYLPSIFLSCSILRYSFHKNAKLFQTLVGSDSHSYDTDPKPVISWWQRKMLI